MTTKPRPYLLNDDGNDRLAIRDNGDGRAWLMAGNKGCLLTPKQAFAAARWLERWAWATEKKTVKTTSLDHPDDCDCKDCDERRGEIEYFSPAKRGKKARE